MKFVWIYIYNIYLIYIYIYILSPEAQIVPPMFPWNCPPGAPQGSWSARGPRKRWRSAAGSWGWAVTEYMCVVMFKVLKRKNTHIYIACWGPTKQLYLYDSIWKLRVPQNRALGALSFPNRQMSLSRSTAMGSVTRKGSSSRLATVAFATCFPQLAILQWEAANVFDLWPVWFAMVPRLCWLRPQKRNPRLWIEILLKGEGYVYLIWCCGWFTLLDPLRNPI